VTQTPFEAAPRELGASWHQPDKGLRHLVSIVLPPATLARKSAGEFKGKGFTHLLESYYALDLALALQLAAEREDCQLAEDDEVAD